jgi:hypothetical protein
MRYSKLVIINFEPYIPGISAQGGFKGVRTVIYDLFPAMVQCGAILALSGYRRRYKWKFVIN